MMRPPVQVKPLRRSSTPLGSGSGPSSYTARSDRQPHLASRPPSLSANSRRAATPRSERPRSTDRPSSGSIGNGKAPELVSKQDEPAKVIERSVMVCVRVRPMTDAEVADGHTQVVACDLDAPGKIHLTRPAIGLEPDRKQETFAFDTVLPGSAGQAPVYNLIGSQLVASIADGCNGCILAFGPTGCGKSHTVFGGQGEARGLLPRLAEKLFAALGAVDGKTTTTFSYLELYKEKVRDLLHHNGVGEREAAASLEVCEHPKVGVFVAGLSRCAVSDADDMLRLLDYGHKIRALGSAHGHASSRSHALAVLDVKQALPGGHSKLRRSKLQVVDMAGAEHLHAGEILRQRGSAYMNGLSAELSKLSDLVAALTKGQREMSFTTSYRDSKLTWLLSESLAGNCRTAMMACVSPASRRADLTSSTLRFAESVQKLHTRPARNEEVHGDLVQTLRGEIQLLQHRLDHTIGPEEIRDLGEQLQAARYLEDDFAASPEEIQERTTAAEQRRHQTLRQLGLPVGETSWEQKVTDGCIYVVNVSLDPLLSGCLTWTLAPGEQIRIGSDLGCEICVDGLGVPPEACCLQCVHASRLEVVRRLRHRKANSSQDSLCSRSLFKRAGPLLVNGQAVEATLALRSGDVVRVGWAHFFRVVIPASASENDRRLGPRPEDTLAIETTYGITFSKEAEQLRERLGVDKATQVLGGLKDLKLAVDEANELTAELRGGEDQLIFKGHLLTDPLDKNEESTMVVSLRSAERPACFEKDSADFSDDRGDLIATWTLPDFQLRLEVMREIYEEVSLRDQPWGEVGDLDPWQAQNFIPVLRAKEPPGSSHDSANSAAHEVTTLPCSKQLTSASTGTDISDEPLDMAAVLQQLPQLHAELAKAYEIQGIQASELVSVRREIEDLRLNLARTTPSPARRPGDPSRSSGTLSPLRGEEMPLLSKSNLVPSNQSNDCGIAEQQPLERSMPRRALTPRRAPAPVWRGAEGPRITSSPAGGTNGPLVFRDQGSPTADTSPKAPLPSPKSSEPFEDSLESEEPAAGSKLVKDVSFAAGMCDTIRCYAPPQFLSAESTKSSAPPSRATGLATVRQFSAPVAPVTMPATARSRVVAAAPIVTTVSGPQTPRYSMGSAALPQGTKLEPQLTPRGWVNPSMTPPVGGAAFPAAPQGCRYVGHSMPTPQLMPMQLRSPPAAAHLTTPVPSPPVLWQVPQVLRTPAVPTVPITSISSTPWAAAPSSRSPSPALQRPRSYSSENVSFRRASTPPAPVAACACADSSRVSTPRFMASEAEAMAKAAAAAVAKAAPGMNVVVRPVSKSQVAMLTQQMRLRTGVEKASSRTVAEDANCPKCNGKVLPDAVFCRHCGHKLRKADNTTEEQLRSCQVELAGLQKEVDSLGQVCRDFQV